MIPSSWAPDPVLNRVMYLEGPRFFFNGRSTGAETLFHDWLGANRQKNTPKSIRIRKIFLVNLGAKIAQKTPFFRGANFPGVFSPEVGLEIEVQ